MEKPVSIDERIEEAIKERMDDCECSYEEVKESIIEDWGEYGLRGYWICISPDTETLHIQKIDELNIYNSDLEAAKQAEKDGIKLIHDIDIPKEQVLYDYKDTFIDTPENREQLQHDIAMCRDKILSSISDYIDDLSEYERNFALWKLLDYHINNIKKEIKEPKTLDEYRANNMIVRHCTVAEEMYECLGYELWVR